MIIGETAKKSYVFHKLLILLILLDNNLLHCSSEGSPIDAPKGTMLAGLDRESSWRFIKQGYLSKAIPDP